MYPYWPQWQDFHMIEFCLSSICLSFSVIHIFFNHLSANGHSCFHILAIVNNAAVNVECNYLFQILILVPSDVYPCTPMYTLIGLLIGLFIHSWARATLAESEILIHLIWAAGLNVCLTISMFPHVPSLLFFFHLLPSHSISRRGSVPPSSCNTLFIFSPIDPCWSF